MARILIIDGNPEQRRALDRLIRHRTSHTVVVADTCVGGVRKIVTARPDLVMINALLFMRDAFAFSRVLKRRALTASLPIMVHTSGRLEDLTRRRLEVEGVAGLVELPVSGGELAAEIEQAVKKARAARPRRREVKKVDWTRIAAGSPDVPAGPAAQTMARPNGRHRQEVVSGEKQEDAGPHRISARDARQRTGAFRPLEVDPPRVKGGNRAAPRFREMEWPEGDLNRVKNPRPEEDSDPGSGKA